MSRQPQHLENLQNLKVDLVNFLTKVPNQSYKLSKIWNALVRDTGKQLNKKDFGVKKMNDTLDLFQDVMVYNEHKVMLLRSPSETPAHSKKVICISDSEDEGDEEVVGTAQRSQNPSQLSGVGVSKQLNPLKSASNVSSTHGYTFLPWGSASQNVTTSVIDGGSPANWKGSVTLPTFIPISAPSPHLRPPQAPHQRYGNANMPHTVPQNPLQRHPVPVCSASIPQQVQHNTIPIQFAQPPQQVQYNTMPIQSAQPPLLACQPFPPMQAIPHTPQMSEFPQQRPRTGPPPGTKIKEQKQEVVVDPIILPPRAKLTSEQVNIEIENCIEILSKAKEHVALEKVENLLLKRFRVSSFQQLRLRERFINQLSAGLEHSKLLSKVNEYIQNFVRSRSMCTLYELAECCREFHPKGGSFEELNLGPLQKMPLIGELFKFPTDEYVPEITSSEILGHLRSFMDKYNKWRSQVSFEEFLKFLKDDVYQVDSVYSLGIRLRSLPLSIQMLKKASHEAAKDRREVMETLRADLTKDLHQAFEKFRAEFLQKARDGTNELRIHYLKLEPQIVLREVFSKFELLSQLFEPETSKAGKMQKVIKSFQQFVSHVLEVPLPCQLFHLSICMSNLELTESASEFLALEAEKSTKQQEEAAKSKAQRMKQPPTKNVLAQRVVDYINLCLQNSGSLNLSHLRKIEEKILTELEFDNFADMTRGERFLDFLLSNASIKVVLEECGGTILGQSGGHAISSGFLPSQKELLEFVCQAKQAGAMQPQHIEHALCDQFRVSKVKQLGHGSLTHLMSAAENPGKHASQEYNAVFEAALCGKKCPKLHLDQSKDQAGVQGRQALTAAKACLTLCPLLENLATWSHWSLVFEPQHGPLREFVEKHGGRTDTLLDGGQKLATSDFSALEVEPGVLLKVSSSCTSQDFVDALNSGDAQRAAGVLTSLVVSNKGVENTQLALLATQVKTRLTSLHAQSPTTDTPGGPPDFFNPNSRFDLAVLFVRDLMLKLPVRICVALADQVLLEPLSQVVGSASSKQQLSQSVTGVPGNQEKLELLGCLLGIQEWVASFSEKVQFPESLIQVMETDELLTDEEGLDGEDVEEEEEEEESSSELDDDDIFNKSVSQPSESVTQKDEPCLEMDKEEPEEEEGEEDEEEEDSEVAEEKEEEDDSSSGMTEGQETSSEKAGDDEDNDEDVDDEEEEDAGDDVEEELSPMDLCHKIVDSIRREEFGEGISLDEAGQQLMNKQYERQGRSLARLSKELYSKDTHFVLELIQNADDNSYTDARPAVKFVIEDTGVTVLNNECGFEEKNIRALCDVGKSTKQKHQCGYIGQKGIGFKSVFRVTGRPEVHSNNYHICFDVNSGPMGYILPHWLEDHEVKPEHEGWQTRIVLPWTEEIRSQIKTHAARFNDIQPSLLLFLHRLKEITIENKVEGRVLSMRREDLSEGEIQIVHSEGTDRWLVLKKQLDASSMSLTAKSGVEVESTEIALAFPLKEKTSLSQAMGHHMKKMPVFAYLPLRTYGFKFIVQGDFDVPSSRENVDRDSSWNQWLRSEIPALFIEALEAFKARPELSPLEALAQFLQFVPLQGEVIDFFQPVASHILKQLKDKNCMPVVSPDKKGGISWRKPIQTVMSRDPLMLEVMSPQILQQQMGLYFLEPHVASWLDKALIESLGVSSLKTEHLLDVGAFVAHNWDESASQAQIGQISKWLACIYRTLPDLQENTQVLDKLKHLKVIPLSGGDLVSLKDATVFLLTDSSGKTSSVSGEEGRGKNTVQKLRNDIHVIHPGLTTTDDQEVNSQVVKLLLRLEVKQLTASDLIHSHIMPVLASEQWKSKSPEVLMSYLIYIKEELDKSPSIIDLNELKPVAQVVTTEGVRCPNEHDVHFSVFFGNKIDLEAMFYGPSWAMVHSGYLPPSASRIDLQTWRKFFSHLGVVDFLRVRPVQLTLDKDALTDTVWSDVSESWPDSPGGYVITDYQCPEFDQLLYGHEPYQKMVNLFETLGAMWDSDYVQYTCTQLRGPDGQLLKKEIKTTFGSNLQSLAWVPSLSTTMIPSQEGHVAIPTEVHDLQMPSDLYVHTRNMFDLLAHTVKYLNAKQSPKGFLDFLQIKTDVSVSVMKNLMVAWCDRGSNPTTPRTMTTSLKHMTKVYMYLMDNLSRKEIQDLFHSYPAIFVPPMSKGSFWQPQDIVIGSMLSRQEVWWDDPSSLFQQYQPSMELHKHPLSKRSILKPLYPGLSELFEIISRVSPAPTAVHLTQLAQHIATVHTLSEQHVLQHILSLYSHIGAVLRKVDEEEAGTRTNEALEAQQALPVVLDLMSNASMFPTKQGQWVGLSYNPMIADSAELEKMFTDKPGVFFLQLETDDLHDSFGPDRYRQHVRHRNRDFDKESVEYLISLFESIRPLSECVASNEITTGFKPWANGQTFLHDVVGLIQRFLYFLFPDIYAQVKEKKADILPELIFSEVEKLEVRYELIDRPEVFEIRSEQCIVKDKNFYFHRDAVGNQVEINREVAKYFSEGDEKCLKELRSFLTQLVPILEGKPGESIEDLLARQTGRIGDLPEEEKVWEVPLPVIPIMKQKVPEPVEMLEQDMVYSQADSEPVAKQVQEEQEENDGLKSWPPRSAVDVDKQAKQAGSGGKKSTVWPPPPAEYAKSRQSLRDLPSNIRVAEVAEADKAGDISAAQGDEANSEAKPSASDFVRQTSSSSGHTGVSRQHSHTGDGSRPYGAGSDGSSIHRQRSQQGSEMGDGGEGREAMGRQSNQDETMSGAEKTDKSGDDRIPEDRSGKRKLTDSSLEEVQETKRLNSTEGVENDVSQAGDGPRRQREGPDFLAFDESRPQRDAERAHRDHSQFRYPGQERRDPSREQLRPLDFASLANQAEDLPYTELAEGDKLAAPELPITEAGNTEVVGHWGEELVNNYLREQQAMQDSNILEIIWPDQQGKHGLPYDFEVVYKARDSDRTYSVFIEVKATLSHKKDFFQLSLNQVKFALEKEDKFQIYRVFGGGYKERKLVRIDNVSERMFLKQLQLWMYL